MLPATGPSLVLDPASLPNKLGFLKASLLSCCVAELLPALPAESPSMLSNPLKDASGAYVFIKQVTSSFASEAISEASHEVGHLLCVLLLQPLLVHLGSPALIPGPVLLLAYQVLLQAHTCLMTAPRDAGSVPCLQGRAMLGGRSSPGTALAPQKGCYQIPSPAHRISSAAKSNLKLCFEEGVMNGSAWIGGRAGLLVLASLVLLGGLAPQEPYAMGMHSQGQQHKGKE
ncbi:MAG: hypothetical protein FRX49_00505 [Trebouxia sp. A1-2]|nr:MAG: hypothetical protein FRX49_00505 [Trebouxia sp. A1-2]